MTLTLFQVDAFANQLFKGNPAAVMPLEQWIDDALMQNLAMENNVADTAFFVVKGDDFEIRWFTPEKEINLCGHATLATAFILYTALGYTKPTITFYSPSGPLLVSKDGDNILLDFPSWKPERVKEYPAELAEILGVKEIVGVYKSRDMLVELNTEADVLQASPDFSRIKKLDEKIIITAPGTSVDFVSRFFAPTYGIDEDPVTGSAHSQLIPFWSEKLGKTKMQARQLSRRGGHLQVEQKKDRVLIGGQCVFYMKGDVVVPGV